MEIKNFLIHSGYKTNVFLTNGIPLYQYVIDGYSRKNFTLKAAKDHNKVMWKRIGSIDHFGEVYEAEKRSGILHHKAHTKEGWEK